MPALVAAALCAAACGAASTPPTSARPAATAASTSPPAPSPTSAASFEPRPSGTRPWPTGFAVEMPEGTYAMSPPFAVPIAITISEPGWHGGHMDAAFTDIQRYDGAPVGGLPTRLLGFALPEQVSGIDDDVAVRGLTPEAAIDLITARGSVASDGRARINLLGLEGERVDLHSDVGNNAVFGSPEGHFGLQPELDLRLVALPLPVEDSLLFVLVMAPAGELEGAWQQALPMLTSAKLQR